MNKETDIEAIAERLRLTRNALGLNQTELCLQADLATNRWNQWERGRVRIQLDGALHLCAVFGLSLDWIYRGDMGSLRHDFVEKIQKQKA